MHNYIPTWKEFLLEIKYSNIKYPMQIVMRGTIGLTSKDEQFTKDYMEILYDNYIRMVLITGTNNYNIKKEIPRNRKNKINYAYPILNFASTQHDILNSNFVKIFNKIADYPISVNKKKFYQEFKGYYFIPKTVYSLENIEDLQLPIIAKPKNGFSAQGIEKFNTYVDAKKSNLEFDTWSECKDINREFRAFVINNKIIHISERIVNNNNDKSVGKKKPSEKIDLIYIDQDMNTFKYMDKIEEIKNLLSVKVNLDFYNIDLILDTNDTLWVPEINGAPGISPSIFYSIYPEYVKLAYSTSVSKDNMRKLKNIAKLYRHDMQKEYPKEYAFSLSPIY